MRHLALLAIIASVTACDQLTGIRPASVECHGTTDTTVTNGDTTVYLVVHQCGNDRRLEDRAA